MDEKKYAVWTKNKESEKIDHGRAMLTEEEARQLIVIAERTQPGKFEYWIDTVPASGNSSKRFRS